jgi:hypothetical protein
VKFQGVLDFFSSDENLVPFTVLYTIWGPSYRGGGFMSKSIPLDRTEGSPETEQRTGIWSMHALYTRLSAVSNIPREPDRLGKTRLRTFVIGYTFLSYMIPYDFT